jgi:transcription initiation factor TFIID subunit TAF12
MKHKRKLPLNEIFMALDMDAKGAYKEWSEDERKELNFWLLNRYASSVGGSQDAKEWAVIATNEYYNKNWNVLGTRHPQLQWQLLCATHNATRKSRHHQWLGMKQKGSDNKAVKFLKDMFPEMKLDEVELLARISTTKELKELAEQHGMDKKDVKV